MTLDPAALDRLLDLGGPPLVRKMIDAFLGSSPKRVEMALESRSNGDLKGIEQAAHSLKSSTANFGATALVELVTEVEQLAAAERRGERLEELLDRLEGEFEAVCSRLVTLRGELGS